jgi:hypothetical protein
MQAVLRWVTVVAWSDRAACINLSEPPARDTDVDPSAPPAGDVQVLRR